MPEFGDSELLDLGNDYAPATEVARMPEFEFTELLPLGHENTPFRLITTEGVSTFDTPQGRFLKVEPETLTLITQEGMRDIAHLLRPGHLQQLRKIGRAHV